MAALDVAGKGLHELPDKLQTIEKLESLHCQGNLLRTLPTSLFLDCQNLKWLDLRNNRLTALPSAMYRLKELRTLLLADNLLETLPVQLSLLPHLTALNLSGNPLKDPPQHVLIQGTKAVLMYLQDKLRGGGGAGSVNGDRTSTEASEGYYHASLSDDSSDEDYSTTQSLSTKRRTSKVGNDHGGATKPFGVSGGPTMHQAVLHSGRTNYVEKSKYQPPPMETSTAHRKTSKKISKRMTRQTELQDSESSRVRLPEISSVTPPVEQHWQKSDQDMTSISNTLEKMKAQQGLEDWRKKARDMQRAKYQDRNSGLDEKSGRTLSQVFPVAGQSPDRDTALAVGAGQEEAKRKLRQLHYKNKLEERRKQAGIISVPTANLQQAEDKLAEALALQDEVGHRNREYRLRAFTGDL